MPVFDQVAIRKYAEPQRRHGAMEWGSLLTRENRRQGAVIDYSKPWMNVVFSSRTLWLEDGDQCKKSLRIQQEMYKKPRTV